MAPECNISEETDVKKEEIEHRSFDIIYEKGIEIRMERRTTQKSNCTKAYAHIFNQYCSRSMNISIM